MPTASPELQQLAKIAHRVTRTEQESRVREIAAALEDAGAKPATGWGVTLEDIAESLYFSSFASRLPSKSSTLDEESKRKISEIRRIVGDLLDFSSIELSAIRELLEEKQASNLTKEWYTVAEAAKLKKHSSFTIRQACNLGRIQDDWKEKDIRTGKWRIHRDAIDCIQNHGLPPINR